MRRAWLIPLLAVAATGAAVAAEFEVRPGPDSSVAFVSKAPMERFEGKTDRLQGRIVVDPAALGGSITVRLEVDLASLDTGIAKRNQHMRENHLETDRYPTAVFEGATIAGAPALAPGQTTSFDAEGTFTLHGVSRPLKVRVEATWQPDAARGGRIEFRTGFPVALADFGISRPQFLFLKLGEVQDIRVSGVAVAAP